MTDELPIVLREPTAADIPFLFSSWLKSSRNEGANRHMGNDVYYAAMKPRVTDALRRGRIVVASTLDDAWQIVGWICFEPGAVHYVYVKYPFRHLGVARRLFGIANPSGEAIACSSTGICFEPVRARYRLTFDPSRLETTR